VGLRAEIQCTLCKGPAVAPLIFPDGISIREISKEVTATYFFYQTGDFGLKLWEMIDNNAPDYLMGYFVISMNNSVASTIVLVSIVKLEFRINF